MCAAQCYTVASADAKAPEFVLGGPAWVPHQTEERQPAITHVPKSVNYFFLIVAFLRNGQRSS